MSTKNTEPIGALLLRTEAKLETCAVRVLAAPCEGLPWLKEARAGTARMLTNRAELCRTWRRWWEWKGADKDCADWEENVRACCAEFHDMVEGI